MKIYIISSVRNATDRERAGLEAYTDWLEDQNHEVHLPHRDTNQQASGLDICFENAAAISMADEIHIFYNEDSIGSHFDLGMVFALDQIEGRRKRIRFVNQGSHSRKSPKTFANMIDAWIHLQNEHAATYPKLKEGVELDMSVPFEKI